MKPNPKAPGSTAEPTASAENRANNFDFLRYLFACTVIVFHALMYLHQPFSDEVLMQYTRGRDDFGRIAVNGFFAISGFLITASWLHCATQGEFAKRRFLRIYPGFVAAVFLTIFVVAPLGGATLPQFWERYTTQDFFSVLWLQNVHNMLPNAFKHNPLRFAASGSLWTIRYEILCYAMVALLGAFGVLRRRIFVLALFLVSLLWYNQVWDTPASWWMFEDWERFPRVFCFFLAGMCAYLYQDRIRYTPLLLVPALSILALVPFVWPPGWSWALPFCFPYILFYVAFSPRVKLHGWAKYGDFSYGVYLYGSAILQLNLYYWPGRWTVMPLDLFSCLIATGVAVLSWHLLEKPMLKLKNRSLPPLPAFLRYSGTGLKTVDSREKARLHEPD